MTGFVGHTGAIYAIISLERSNHPQKMGGKRIIVLKKFCIVLLCALLALVLVGCKNLAPAILPADFGEQGLSEISESADPTTLPTLSPDGEING